MADKDLRATYGFMYLKIIQPNIKSQERLQRKKILLTQLKKLKRPLIRKKWTKKNMLEQSSSTLQMQCGSMVNSENFFTHKLYCSIYLATNYYFFTQTEVIGVVRMNVSALELFPLKWRLKWYRQRSTKIPQKLTIFNLCKNFD